MDPFPGQDLSLRASDADRDRVANLVREAFAEGRLDVEEHAERVEKVYAARTLADLAPVVADLPGPSGAVLRRPEGNLMPVSRVEASSPPVIAIFGGAERAGHWVVPEGHATVAVFGGVDLDLREAELASQHTTITAVAIFGGIDITVPDGVEVKLAGFSIFGGSDGPKSSDPLPAGAPVLTVRAYALFGGVSVRRKKPRR